MSKKILMIPVLMLTLSSKVLGSSDESLLTTPTDQSPQSQNSQQSIYDKVNVIKSHVKSATLTREGAINLLYHLGVHLPKGANGIVDIIDTLGDLGAMKEGLTLLERHGL